METYDLINEMNSLCNKLSASGEALKKYGREYAAAERDYKICLREQAMKLRSSGEAIGMIDKTVYGIPEVAKLRFERDVAETMYKVSLESINTLKLKIRVLNDQISREWQAAGRE